MTHVKMLDARPDPHGGYRVDVGRGERIARVSSSCVSSLSRTTVSVAEHDQHDAYSAAAPEHLQLLISLECTPASLTFR